VSVSPTTIDTAAYADYMRTLEGRLRVNLAWENLRAFLPSKAQGRALDIGCGTGEMTSRLAGTGLHVTALDCSDTMLAETQRSAAEAGLQERVGVVCASATQLRNLFSPASFDVIVCHNLLEFIDRPSEMLQAIQVLLKKDVRAIASIVVRNRAGEVLSAALKAGDLAAAEANLTASKVRAKLTDGMVALFTPAELRSMVSDTRLELMAEYGVRVLSDYLPKDFLDNPANCPLLLALEQKLGKRPDFAGIARYYQVIARATNPSAPGEGQTA
jgi:S-adenosylmethionine-dependent methyltransferase